MATEKAREPALKFFQINFKYVANEKGDMRTSSRIRAAATAAEARNMATKDLANQHDWFNITMVKEVNNEHPQQTI